MCQQEASSRTSAASVSAKEMVGWDARPNPGGVQNGALAGRAGVGLLAT